MTVLYLLSIVIGLWLLARTVYDFQNQQTSMDALFDYMGPDWDVNPDSHSFLYWLALGAQAVLGFSVLSAGIVGFFYWVENWTKARLTNNYSSTA